jgi:hypothetical protein
MQLGNVKHMLVEHFVSISCKRKFCREQVPFLGHVRTIFHLTDPYICPGVTLQVLL